MGTALSAGDTLMLTGTARTDPVQTPATDQVHCRIFPGEHRHTCAIGPDAYLDRYGHRFGVGWLW